MNWTGSSGPITNSSGRPARTGTWKMWLGGNGSTSTAYDTNKVQIVNGSTTSTLATYSNANANNTYVQKTLDVTSYKGKTIKVSFLMNEDYSLQTSFVVDDTSLTVS